MIDATSNWFNNSQVKNEKDKVPTPSSNPLTYSAFAFGYQPGRYPQNVLGLVTGFTTGNSTGRKEKRKKKLEVGAEIICSCWASAALALIITGGS